MKNTIINILIFILMFNVIMIIFPDGKTQRFTKLTVKIFIMIYIIDNIFLSSNIKFDSFLNDIPEQEISYEREINLESINNEYIDIINNDIYNGEDVVKNIVLNFDKDLNINAVVTLNKVLNIEDTDELKNELASIFDISAESIKIDS
jgi:hypothetical protein